MIFITGDTHRNFSHIEDFCKYNATAKDDVMIILGDTGINYYGAPHDTVLKHELNALPITLFCVHGNHEMRPESIATYEEAEKYGGIVYIEPDFPSLLFAKDGEIYDFDGQRCIVIGGAYSVDKDVRIVNDWGWWEDEQPDEWIKSHVESQLKAENWRVDTVFSHTCPEKYIPTECFLPGIDNRRVDRSTEEWLDEIENKLNYSDWYCGHWHTEKYIEKMRFMFENIMELGDY